MKKLLAFVLALSLLCMGGVALADGETLVIYSARNERLNNIVIPAFEILKSGFFLRLPSIIATFEHLLHVLTLHQPVE